MLLLNKKILMQFILLNILTLIFLAANSILCRLALLDNNIDAYSFTFFRLFFAVITLILIMLFIKKQNITIKLKDNWLNAFMLFVYAATFSYSYLNMDAGVGTLILFAIVQLTMILSAIKNSEKLTLKVFLGLIIAFLGLIYLLYPKEEFSLSITHTILMIISGIAWAFYSILGKATTKPLEDTTTNFIKTLPFLAILYLFTNDIFITKKGLFLAFLSGSITSAIGYVLWYIIIKKIKIVTASIIQLIIPIFAILLGVIFLNEQLTFTLILSTSIILLGIFISLYKKSPN